MLYGKTYKLKNVKVFKELILSGWTKTIEDDSIWLRKSKTGDIYQIKVNKPAIYKAEDKIIVRQVSDSDFLVLELVLQGDIVKPLWFAHFSLKDGITDKKYSERFDLAGSITDCDYNGSSFEVRMLSSSMVLLKTKKETCFYDVKNAEISCYNFKIKAFSGGFLGEWDKKYCVCYFNPFTYEPITPCYSRLRQKCLDISSLEMLRWLEREDEKKAQIGEKYRSAIPALSFEEKKKILLRENGLVEEKEPEKNQCPFFGSIITYPHSIIRPEITENQIIFYIKEKTTVVELGEECVGLNQIGEDEFLAVTKNRETKEYTLRALALYEGYKEDVLAGPSKEPDWFLSPGIFVDGDNLYYFISKFKGWRLWKANREMTILVRDGNTLRPYRISDGYHNESFCLVDFYNRRIGGKYVVGPNQFFKDEEAVKKYKREAEIAEEIVELPTWRDRTDPKKLEKQAKKVMEEYCKINNIPL